MSTLNSTSLRSTALTATLALALSTALLAGCTTLSVHSDYDSKVSMNVCHTYAWTEHGPMGGREVKAFDNPLNNKRLRDAVQANLSAHGLTLVQDRGAADCMVAYAIGTRQRVDVDNGYPHFGWGLGLGWGGRRGFGSLGFEDDVYAYREGRISVDIFNARSNDPIWHAAVDEDVSYLTGSDAEARISNAVKAVFTKYPAGATT